VSGGVGDPAGGSELSGRQVSSQPGQEFHHSARPRRLLHSTGTETSSQASHAIMNTTNLSSSWLLSLLLRSRSDSGVL